jgi:hypothetical protein
MSLAPGTDPLTGKEVYLDGLVTVRALNHDGHF